MGELDDKPSRPRRRLRGLESVVRLYVSRPRTPPELAEGPIRPPAAAPLASLEGAVCDGPAAAPPAPPTELRSDLPATAPPLPDTREQEAGPATDEEPPLEPGDDEPAAGEERLPPVRVGEEGKRAEAAFELETRLLPVAGRVAEDVGRVEPVLPRVLLVLGAVPYQMRRMLLEALASPFTSEGHRVMLVETDAESDIENELYEDALGLDLPIFKRRLGRSTREVLLLRPAERTELFKALSADERRSRLVLINLELPETMLSPRLQFLVDGIVVALTARESSLYEAYRALRGLRERRPELAPFVVPLANSEEDAALLLDRFRRISKDFLSLGVLEGGWLRLAAGPPNEKGRGSHGSGISPSLEDLATGASPSALPPNLVLRERGRPFFDHLREWFDNPL